MPKILPGRFKKNVCKWFVLFSYIIIDRINRTSFKGNFYFQILALSSRIQFARGTPRNEQKKFLKILIIYFLIEQPTKQRDIFNIFHFVRHIAAKICSPLARRINGQSRSVRGLSFSFCRLRPPRGYYAVIHNRMQGKKSLLVQGGEPTSFNRVKNAQHRQKE